MSAGRGTPGDRTRETRAPRPAASTASLASVACAAGGVALVALGGLGGRTDLLGAVAAHGALVVALGATIVGTTLAAVALLATRAPGADSAARSRAWVGVAANLGLLIGLLAVFAGGVGRPLVVDVASPPEGDEAPAEGKLMDAAALQELRAARPDLLPVAVPETVDVAFERARRTAAALGWQIVARDDAAHRLEARAAGPGSGEGSDLEIRVHPAPEGSVVAIRPKGPGDEDHLEASRARMRAFSERLTRS